MRCRRAIAARTARLCMRCDPREFIAGRLALRGNHGASRWSFFPLPEAAEQQGFRACLRCRPRLVRLRDPRTAAVARVCREIEAQIDADGGKSAAGNVSEARMTLSTLSSTAGMNAYQLERAFRSVMGISPRQYADARRMRRLKSSLRKGDDVTTALYDAGFGSSSRLYERAPTQLGMTPATYRQGGAGMQIHYTIVGSPLGRLLVGATNRGSARCTLEKTMGRWRVRCGRSIRARRFSGTGMAWKAGWGKYWSTCAGENRIWIYRRTYRRLRSSGACGKNCARFRMARRGRTARWRGRLASRRQFERWRGHARRIQFRWWCRAIAWCAKTAIWPAIAGDWSANSRCWSMSQPGVMRRGSDKNA